MRKAGGSEVPQPFSELLITTQRRVLMSSLALLGNKDHNQSQSPFDSIKHTDEQGREYWMARELMGLLGYPRWNEFKVAIERAIVSCEAQQGSNEVSKHFSGSTPTKTSGRPRNDYRLSRYACYLVAMSADPRKPEIAEAQAYFAVKLTLFDGLIKHFTGCSPDIFSKTSRFERDPSGFVYLIEAVGVQRYKIGYSKEVYKRASNIQTSTPFEISVLYRYFSVDAPQLEKLLHEYYDAYRIRGEWFELPLSEVSNFLNVANELDQGIELNTEPELWANQKGDRQLLIGE